MYLQEDFKKNTGPKKIIRKIFRSLTRNSARNSDGFSIVESLVAVGIMSIVMMGFTQMMWNQSRQTKGFEETLARLDVEKTLATFLADGSVCGATLAGTLPGTAPKTFDINNFASTSFSLNSIPSSSLDGAADLLAVDQQASSVSNSLKVDTIAYKNIQNTGPDKYTVDLVVTFKGGVRPLRPLNIKTIITTVTADPLNPAIKEVIGCNSSSGGGTMTAGICDSLSGTYNAATGKCDGVGSSGLNEFSGASCPAGSGSPVSFYWDSKRCGSLVGSGTTCRTAVGWFAVAPTCTYRTGYTASTAKTCTAVTWSRVRCM